jgi:hypothetical protein
MGYIPCHAKLLQAVKVVARHEARKKPAWLYGPPRLKKQRLSCGVMML